MREEDCRMSNPEHDELRDIHRRIDSLKEESERHYGDIREKLHGLEVAVAKGSRFPASALVAAAAIILSTIGTGTVLYHRLEEANSNAGKALMLIERHLEQAPVHRQRVEDMTEAVDNWKQIIPLCEERLKNLEAKVVGKGPDGWHRKDHDMYAELVRVQIESLKQRIEQLEKKR